MIVCLDIETGYDYSPEQREHHRQKLLAKLPTEVKADSRLTDPKKIEANLAKKRADLEKKKKEVDDQVQEWVDKTPLSPLTGRIVAVAVATKIVSDDSCNEITWKPEVFTAKTPDEEGPMLEAVGKFLREQRCSQLVTFNGKQFDLPYMMARAMKHQVEMEWKLPVKRWDRRHIDLRDTLTKGKLEAWSRQILGCGKLNGIDGSEVPKMAAKGEWDRLEKYAKQDVILNGQLYDRLLAVADVAPVRKDS